MTIPGVGQCGRQHTALDEGLEALHGDRAHGNRSEQERTGSEHGLSTSGGKWGGETSLGPGIMVLMNHPSLGDWVSVASYEHLSGCLHPRAAVRA